MKKIFSLLMLQVFCLATLSDFSWGLATPSGVHSKASRSQRVKILAQKAKRFSEKARKNVGSILTKKTPDFLNKNTISILAPISLTLFIVATLASFGIISAPIYVPCILIALSLFLCIFSALKVFFEFYKSKTDKNNVLTKSNEKSSRTSAIQVEALPIPKRSYLNLTILFIQALLTFGTLICTAIFFNASISVAMGATLIGISTSILFLVGAAIACYLITIIKTYKYSKSLVDINPSEINVEGDLGSETQMTQTSDRSAIEIDPTSLGRPQQESQRPSLYVSEEEPSDKTTSPRRDRLKPVFFKILNNTSEFLWNPITQVVSNIIFLSVFTCSVLMIFNIIPIAAPILSYLPYILLSISVLFYLINIPFLLLKTSELDTRSLNDETNLDSTDSLSEDRPINNEEGHLRRAKSTTSLSSYREATGRTIYYGDLDNPDSLSENTDKTISKKTYAFSAITAFQSLLFLTTAIIIFTFHTSFATIALPVIFGTFSFILSVLTIAPVILIGVLLYLKTYVKTFEFKEVDMYSKTPQNYFELLKHNIRALRKIYSRLNTTEPEFLTQNDQNKIKEEKNKLRKFLKRKQIQRRFTEKLDTLISKLSKNLSDYNEEYQRILESLITKKGNSNKDLNYYEKIEINNIIDYLNNNDQLLKILIDTNLLYEDLKSYFDLSQSEPPQSIKERFENELHPDSLNRSA